MNLLYHEYIPANLFTFIGVTFFIIRVPRFEDDDGGDGVGGDSGDDEDGDGGGDGVGGDSGDDEDGDGGGDGGDGGGDGNGSVDDDGDGGGGGGS